MQQILPPPRLIQKELNHTKNIASRDTFPIITTTRINRSENLGTSNLNSISTPFSKVAFECPTGHETDIWFMGRNGIDWSADTPRIINGFNTSTWDNNFQEGHSSICDRNGKLLFYTDNQTIYNGAHQAVTSITSKSTSMMTLILPQPGNDSIYYFFYADAAYDYQIDHLAHPLYYTTINSRGNNNNGAVIKRDQVLLNGSSEKVTGVRHCNGKDWWVLGLRSEDEAFHAWKLTDTGLVINSPVISYSGILHNNALSSRYQNTGYLMPSHNGSIIADITNGQNLPGYLELHKFDPSTGIISSGIEIFNRNDSIHLYAAQFSRDNSKLYLPVYEHLILNTTIFEFNVLQLDINKWDTSSIRNNLFRFRGPKSNSASPIIGKNDKIYITTWGNTNKLHVINKPNKKGAACDIKFFSFDFGSTSAISVPLFPTGLQFPYRLYIQGSDSFCADTTVQYILSDPCPHPTTEWTLLDGGQLMSQNGDTIQVYYSNKGNYRIAASYPTDCGLKTDTLKIEVTTCNCYPSISWVRMDTTICEGDRALFQYSSTSTQILLNNVLLNTDTFSISNLKNDTSIQLMIKYPRSCDSILNINIKVYPSSNSEDQITLCEGDSVFVENKWIYDTDTLVSNYSNSFGCDSTHSIIIQKIKKDSLQFQVNICEGDSILVFGIWRYIPEILRENYLSSSGCDSIVTYEVKVNPLFPKQTNRFTICPGDSILLNSKWYKDSVIIIERLHNQFGCDSIIENIISVHPYSSPSFEIQLLCPGDSILINGTYYKDTISITNNFQNQFGCDSLHIIQIQFHPNVSVLNLKHSFCDGDSTQFENLWIKRDSQIFRTFPSASMCDSLVIHQFIKLNKSTPTTEIINLCHEDSFLIQNKWYHQDTSIQIHYQNQYTCDSVHTIDLLFYPFVQNAIDSISICKGDSILISNKWYFDSGQIQQRFTNQFGCDSIKQTQILLRPGPEPVELSFYFCQGDSVRIKNNWYYKETNFIERKSSPFSCDTLITYHVQGYDDIFVDIGQDITLNAGEVIKLNPNYSSNVISYKWFPASGLSCTDCPSPELTAKSDITYFLEVLDHNGCLDLDSITIHVNEIKSEIYLPNIFSPNGDNINDIWMPVLTDVQGRIVSLSIYDRWGNEVYNCENKSATLTPCGWNGMFKDNKCLPGVYVYHVSWEDQYGNLKNLIGDVTLIR